MEQNLLDYITRECKNFEIEHEFVLFKLDNTIIQNKVYLKCDNVIKYLLNEIDEYLEIINSTFDNQLRRTYIGIFRYNIQNCIFLLGKLVEYGARYDYKGKTIYKILYHKDFVFLGDIKQYFIPSVNKRRTNKLLFQCVYFIGNNRTKFRKRDIKKLNRDLRKYFYYKD